MNFWERLFLSPEWPLWQLIIGILIATFAISVILLVWKIIDNFREKKIMSSLLKGADKGLAKPANVSESDNIMEQIGQTLGSQATQVVSKVQEYVMVNAGINQASMNQQNIKDVQEATTQAINSFNKKADEIDKLGRGSSYNQGDVANISLNYSVSSSDISQSIDPSVASQVDENQSVEGQQSEELSVSDSVDEPSQEVEVDEAWVKAKVLDFQCVKSQINSYNLDDDWTFSNLSQRAFMEIYRIFNQKRAEQNPSDDVQKIYDYLREVKENRGF